METTIGKQQEIDTQSIKGYIAFRRLRRIDQAHIAERHAKLAGEKEEELKREPNKSNRTNLHMIAGINLVFESIAHGHMKREDKKRETFERALAHLRMVKK